MVLLDWYGGRPSSVIRFGFEPRLFRYAIGNCCGQKVFGYTSDSWCLDFGFDDEPTFKDEIWFFDNEVPVFITGD